MYVKFNELILKSLQKIDGYSHIEYLTISSYLMSYRQKKKQKKELKRLKKIMVCTIGLG